MENQTKKKKKKDQPPTPPPPLHFSINLPRGFPNPPQPPIPITQPRKKKKKRQPGIHTHKGVRKLAQIQAWWGGKEGLGMGDCTIKDISKGGKFFFPVPVISVSNLLYLRFEGTRGGERERKGVRWESG